MKLGVVLISNNYPEISTAELTDAGGTRGMDEPRPVSETAEHQAHHLLQRLVSLACSGCRRGLAHRSFNLL